MTSLLTLSNWIDRLRPMGTGSGMIIIAGMPKSGTTAIAKLLGIATGRSVCGDPFHRLGEQTKIDFREEIYGNKRPLQSIWREYRCFFSGTIIKDPNFSLLLPQVRTLFPNAQLVFIIRDPRDTIRSILNRLNLPGRPNGIDLDSTDIPPGWRKVLMGQTPKIEGKDYIEILSKHWVMSAQAYLEHRHSCLLIRHEDFEHTKTTAIYGLAALLGYPVVSDISDFVDVQYQPKGDSNVSWTEFYGEPSLKAIDRATAPTLEQFGYAPTS